MSLARLFPTLSQVLIRKLGDAGGPRADQVSQELDNIIASVPRTVFTSVPALNPTSGTVTSTLTTIPGGTLNKDGDYLEIKVFGRFVSTANNKEIRLNVNQGGAQILCTTGTFTTGAPVNWEAYALVRRDSSVNLNSRAYGIKSNAIYGQTDLFVGGTWNWANSFTVDIVTVLTTAAEVFIDRVLILKHTAP